MSTNSLRFKEGDRVIVRELNWAEATITELRCTTKRGLAAAYRVRSLDAKDVFILEDSVRFIREYVEPGAARLMQSVKYGDSADHVSRLCGQYDIDISMIGKSLLLCAASSGNITVAQWLIDTCKVNYLGKDENGRNILHLALMNKQFTFIESLPQCKDSIITSASDSKGFNIFHFLVMSKNIPLLNDALYRGKFKFSSNERVSSRQQSVVKLVDIHGERFGPAASQREAHSRAVSPLDWAQRTRQLDMADILQKYLYELHVDHLMWDLRTNEANKACTDAQFLLKLTRIRGRILIYDLTLDRLTNVGEFFVSMYAVQQFALNHGMTKSLIYMGKNFTLEVFRRAFDPYNLAVSEINSVIEGPENQSFWPAGVEPEPLVVPQVKLAAAAAFNFVSPGFDHRGTTDFGTYLENKRCEWEYEGVRHRCFQGLNTAYMENQENVEEWLSNVGDWMSNACEYIDKYILRARGVLVKERIATIEYIRNRVPGNTARITLPPHLFVHHGQLQLLQWAVAKQYVDVNASAGQCAALVEYVERLPWLSLINKKKKKKKGGAAVDPTVIPPHLTVGEVLCALAAGLGEYLILRWLLEECIPREKYNMCVGGQSLLLIAATQNRAIIIDYLIGISVGNPAFYQAFFFQYVEAARESCQRGYFASGLMLICNCSVYDAVWESIYGIAVKAPNVALRQWAYVTRTTFYAHKVYTLLDTNPTPDAIAEHFDRCGFFAADSLENNRTNLKYCSIAKVHVNGELRDVGTVTGKFAAVMILACHAVLKNSLTLLKQILSAIATHCSVDLLQKFVAEMTQYARSQGNTAAVDVLASALQASERSGALLLIDIKRLLTEGAPIAQVEELLNQVPVCGDGAMHTRFARIASNEDEVKSWLEGLAAQGHVHCIKWLIEVVQLRPTFATASTLVVAATRAVQLPVLKYFLCEVFLRPKRLLRSEKPEANISSSALAAVFDKVFGIIFTGMDALKTDVLNAIVPFFDMLHSVLQDVIKYKLAINVEVLLKDIIKRTHWDDSERWWEVLRLVLGVEAYRNKLAVGDGYLSDVVGLTTMSELGPARCTSTTKLLHFLIDNGANAALEMERVVVSCQRIWKHHVPHSFVVVLKCFAACGINVQSVVFALDYISANEQDASKVAAASVELEALKAEQRKFWAVAEAISAGRPIEFLQSLVEEEGAAPVQSMRDRQGHNLLQVAALSNRGEVILWLKEMHNMDITVVDSQGLSLLQLCRRAGSLQAARVLEETIYGNKVCAFCHRHFHRRRILRLARAARAHRAHCVILLQSRLRGWSIRKRYAPLLKEVTGTYEAFTSKWGAVLSLLKSIKTRNLQEFTWAEQKFKYDMAVDAQDEDVENVREFALHAATAQLRLSSSSAVTAELEFSSADAAVRDLSAVDLNDAHSADPVCAADAVEMSQAVQRWLDKADTAYRTMFYKKVARLAQGDRSYALSKRLKGCEYPICESKLDAGQRILWTSICRDTKQHLLIWFVAKHDNVSRCAELIDSALSRTFRSLNHASGTSTTSPDLLLSEELLQLSEDSVLLDPSRNVPMKIYIAQRSELPLLAEKAWRAPLRLNQREQGVRVQTGTVLLLGRSGTGKTLCVMDRMSHDRKNSYLVSQEGEADGAGGYRQLFVTRSIALCDTARTFQQHSSTAEDLAHTTFLTFESFLRQLETTSSSGEQAVAVPSRAPAKKVDFQRFRDNVFPLLTTKAARTLDALVVWTQIRSFLKGSIEAALEGGVLSLTTYLDTSKFSRDRCRLLPEQRQEVYALFVQYQALHELHGWWDDMDRASDVLMPLLPALQTGALSSTTRNEYHYDKVYVDEVQDNTQVEVSLYLVAVGCRVDALFLAGDPAQSVVEGVEFRFEEVRSLVYVLSQQQEALQRPTKLLVNYRSHSGILNCAGAVLGRMLAMFPGAAKTLPADEGLFLGPRPAFYNATLGMGSVAKMLSTNERTVVLCPDQLIGDINDQLASLRDGGDSSKGSLVLGIRAAKGLEFTDIVLLDFFSAISDSDYKAWKELLAVGDETNNNSHSQSHGSELQQYAFPQLEPQLKLLYTGITRCINRLIFVESKRSRIGGLFFRWLKQHGLADAFAPQTNTNTATSSDHHVPTLMTRDEWRMRGIDFAVAAEGSTELSRAAQLLNQAALCFQRADEPALKNVAMAHAALLQAGSTYCSRELTVEQQITQALSSAEEVVVASTVLRGLRMGLIQSTRNFCQALEERLPAQSKKFFSVDLIKMF